ncbi:MAG: glycosyltransferase family 39 protein [Planctomycetota bacterium]
MLRHLPTLKRATAPDPIWEDLFGDVGKFRWSVVAFLALCLMLGGVLRFANLGGESIWYDEACSMRMAAAPAAGILAGSPFDPGNPPGYFLLLHAWCDIFGHDIVSARMLSAFAGTLLCIPIWLLCMSVSWDRRIATIATSLAVVNPALIFLSREARTFSICALLITILAYVAIRLVRRERIVDWVAFMLCGNALVFCHYYNLFLMVIVSLPVIVGRRRHLAQTLPALGAVATAILVPFALWLPVFVRQLSAWSAPDVPWWKHAVYFPVYVVGGRTFVWKQDGLPAMGLAWVAVCTLILVPVIWGLRRSPKSIGIPLAIGVGMPAFAVMMSVLKDPMLNCRYLSPVIPCLIVAATISIWWLSRTTRWVGVMALGTSLLIAATSLPRMYGETHKDDWRGVAQYVQANGRDHAVVFKSDIGVIPFRYYLPEQTMLALKMDFDQSLDNPRMRQYEAQMRAMGDFYVAHWVAFPEENIPPVQRWLSQRFERVEAKQFRGILLERYRPADL